MLSPTSTTGVAALPQLDQGTLEALATNPEAASARDPKLMAVCQRFEAVLLSQLMRVMRQGESEDKLFGGGMADGIYREMLDDQLASEMANTGSTGIAGMLYAQLERSAEATEAKTQLTGAAGEEAAISGHGTDTRASSVMEATDALTTEHASPEERGSLRSRERRSP